MEIAKYWKTIVDTLQDGLMVLDPAGNILAVNPAAERLTGYSKDELIGNNCRTLNYTGCDIYGRGEGKQWCSLFVSGEVRAKKCLISDKNRRAGGARSGTPWVDTAWRTDAVFDSKAPLAEPGGDRRDALGRDQSGHGGPRLRCR